MGDYSGYALQTTGVAYSGHVPFYNSLNLWMNKPSMTSSPSVVTTSSYAPKQTMSDLDGKYRMGVTSVWIQPPEFYSHSDRSQVYGPYNRWQPQAIDPTVSSRQLLSFSTKPFAVSPTQRNLTTSNSQDIYNHHSLIEADDVAVTSAPSSKEKSLMTPKSDDAMLKSNLARDVPGGNVNIYVAEPHRVVREKETVGVPLTRPSVPRPLVSNISKPPGSMLGNFPISVGDAGLRNPGQDEKEVLDEIDELYGRINPSTKAKKLDQVRENSRSTASQIEGQVPNSSNDLGGTEVQGRFSSDSSSSSLPQSPRKVEDPSDLKPDRSRKIEDSSPAPRSRLPRTDVGHSPTPSSPPPSSTDQVPVELPLPRKNLGRNQPTVGYRMLRDVLKGKKRSEESSASPSVDERNVIRDIFRFLDDFEN